MYNSPYFNTYNPQASVDRINSQIAELEKLKSQIPQNNQSQQPSNLTQNFQISPINRETIKYASSIDEIQRENVVGDTPYFSRDMSVVWIKNAKGEIKSYELKEIIFKDERDLLIESLQMQVNELRKEVKENAKSINTNDDEPSESKKSTNVSNDRNSKKK